MWNCSYITKNLKKNCIEKPFMSKKSVMPEEVKSYYDYLTTPRILKPPICAKDQIEVFSWAPLLAFVYGEHAVLSGHKALLFKPNTFVAVALVLEKNVPDFMIRLRAYAKVEALNRFINKNMDDFEPVTEHEEADLIKFELIEKLIEKYIQMNTDRLKKDHDELFGTVILHHISYFRPGSGINWSGSSAIAISYAVHEFYFERKYTMADIVKLAFPIELIYQEGRASGYGLSILSSSSVMNYRLTDRGLDKINNLKRLKTILKIGLNGNRSCQDKFVEQVLTGESVILKKHRDFIFHAPRSKLDVSIAKLLKTKITSFLIDTGIPKSTGKILLKLEKRKIDETWHTQLAQIWEDRSNVSIDSIDKFIEFVKEVSGKLTKYNKNDKEINTKLWIPAYSKIDTL